MAETITFKNFKGVATQLDYEDVDTETTPDAKNVQVEELGTVSKRPGIVRFDSTGLQDTGSSLKDTHRLTLPDTSKLSVVVDNESGEIIAMKQFVPEGKAQIPLEVETPTEILATADKGDDTVTFLATTVERAGQFAVKDQPVDMVFSPDGRWLYVANKGAKTVQKFDAENTGASALWVYDISSEFTTDLLSLAVDSSGDIYLGVGRFKGYLDVVTFADVSDHLYTETGDTTPESGDDIRNGSYGNYLIKIDNFTGEELWKLHGTAIKKTGEHDGEQNDFDTNPSEKLLFPMGIAYFNSKLYVHVGAWFTSLDALGDANENGGQGACQTMCVLIYDTDGNYESSLMWGIGGGDVRRDQWTATYYFSKAYSVIVGNQFLCFSCVYLEESPTPDFFQPILYIIDTSGNQYKFNLVYVDQDNPDDFFDSKYRGITTDGTNLFFADEYNETVHKFTVDFSDLPNTEGGASILPTGSGIDGVAGGYIYHQTGDSDFPIDFTALVYDDATLSAPMDCVFRENKIWVTSSDEDKVRVIDASDGQEVSNSPLIVGDNPVRIVTNG